MTIDSNQIMDVATPVSVAIPENATVEVSEAINTYNEDVKELQKVTSEKLHEDTNELLSKIEDSLTAAFNGATDTIVKSKERITEILGKYEVSVDPSSYETDDANELVQLSKIISSAVMVTEAVKEVSSQQKFLEYVSKTHITASIAATPNLIFKEYDKLRHFLRKHRVSDFKFDSIFKLTEKYNSVQSIRDCNVTLYCFFRYLNSLNEKNTLVQNFIYAKYTAAIISAGYVTNKQLNLTTAVLNALPAK